MSNTKPRICRDCGQRLRPDEKRCPYCGGKPKGNAARYWLIALLIVALGAVGTVGYMIYKKDRQAETPRTFTITPAFTANVRQYVKLQPFSEGMAAVADASGKWGYIDTTGVAVVKCQYDHAAPFVGGAAQVKKGRSLIYIDKTGKVVDGARHNGRVERDQAFVVFRESGLNGKYGIHDADGNVVVEAIYDSLSHVANGMAVAVIYMDRLKGIDIDRQMETPLPDLEYYNLEQPIDFIEESDITSRIVRGRLYGYVDMQGGSTFDDDAVQRGLRARARIEDFRNLNDRRRRLDDERQQRLKVQREQAMRDSLDAVLDMIDQDIEIYD